MWRGTLTIWQTNRVRKTLRAAGRKMPKVGYCSLFVKGPGSRKRVVPWNAQIEGDEYVREVCHDGRGYYLVYGADRTGTDFDGLRRRRRRR